MSDADTDSSVIVRIARRLRQALGTDDRNRRRDLLWLLLLLLLFLIPAVLCGPRVLLRLKGDENPESGGWPAVFDSERPGRSSDGSNAAGQAESSSGGEDIGRGDRSDSGGEPGPGPSQSGSANPCEDADCPPESSDQPPDIDCVDSQTCSGEICWSTQTCGSATGGQTSEDIAGDEPAPDTGGSGDQAEYHLALQQRSQVCESSTSCGGSTCWETQICRVVPILTFAPEQELGGTSQLVGLDFPTRDTCGAECKEQLELPPGGLSECGQACASDSECFAGQYCIGGSCVVPYYGACGPPPLTIAAACDTSGGVQTQADVCVCPGTLVTVIGCGNGLLLQFVTETTCPTYCGDFNFDSLYDPYVPSVCSLDGVCAPTEDDTCRDCWPGDGTCSAACESDGQCMEGLSCENGACWDGAVCSSPPPAQPPPLPSPTSEPQDDESNAVCADNGGVQWQGQTCVCAGVVDVVTICQDGSKTDTLTDIGCTPNPADCPLETEEPPSGSVCGNGILEDGEQCDIDSTPCGVGLTCLPDCTCEILH